MKKFTILLMFIATIILITACISETAIDSAVDSVGDSTDSLTPSQMQHDPMSFTGEITIVGVVGSEGRFNFSVTDDDDAFHIPIDYRGRQALPEQGAVIEATGQMNYRPCCGPHLISTRFEVVE